MQRVCSSHRGLRLIFCTLTPSFNDRGRRLASSASSLDPTFCAGVCTAKHDSDHLPSRLVCAAAPGFHTSLKDQKVLAVIAPARCCQSLPQWRNIYKALHVNALCPAAASLTRDRQLANSSKHPIAILHVYSSFGVPLKQISVPSPGTKLANYYPSHG